MKTIIISIAAIILWACSTSQKSNTTSEVNATVTTTDTTIQVKTIYDFSATTIDGKNFAFSSLKGKKIMIVNTASKCGLTPQYEGLEKLYQKYKDKNFVIVGFPANDFLKQEPGTNEEIASFCQKNYGVSFQMMEKISVKGSDMHPIYQFLTKKSQNGLSDNSVSWNFQKYLIGVDGKLQKIIDPRTDPLDTSITAWIEAK